MIIINYNGKLAIRKVIGINKNNVFPSLALRVAKNRYGVW